MAKIISFINYKGGVGKTTTTYHIGCSLSYHFNKKVLLVDIDPQSNLTFLCKDYESWLKFKKTNGTILNMFSNYVDKISDSTRKYIWQDPVGYDRYTKIHNLDLLPCDLDLLGEDIMIRNPIENVTVIQPNPFAALQKHSKETLKLFLFLNNKLSEIKNQYDYILIDCPPNIYLMTQNALFSSDYYIITTIPEYLSLIGLNILQNKIEQIGKRVNQISATAGERKTKIASLGGIIFVKVRIGGQLITKQHQQNIDRIKEQFKNIVFDNYTTEMIGYSEAAENRLPIWLTNTPNAKKAAKKMEYERITEEFLRRFE